MVYSPVLTSMAESLTPLTALITAVLRLAFSCCAWRASLFWVTTAITIVARLGAACMAAATCQYCLGVSGFRRIAVSSYRRIGVPASRGGKAAFSREESAQKCAKDNAGIAEITKGSSRNQSDW